MRTNVSYIVSANNIITIVKVNSTKAVSKSHIAQMTNMETFVSIRLRIFNHHPLTFYTGRLLEIITVENIRQDCFSNSSGRNSKVQIRPSCLDKGKGGIRQKVLLKFVRQLRSN